MDTTKAIEMSRLATAGSLVNALMQKAMDTAAMLIRVMTRKYMKNLSAANWNPENSKLKKLTAHSMPSASVLLVRKLGNFHIVGVWLRRVLCFRVC